MNSAYIRKVLTYLVTAATAGAICYFVYIKRDVLIANLLEQPCYLVIVCLTYVLMRVFDGLRLKCIADSMGFKLKPEEWLGLPIMMFFYSFLLPQAGLFANAFYLKKRHNSHISDYFSIGLMRTLNTFVVAITTGLVTTVYLFRYGYDYLGELFFIYGLGFIFMVLLYVLSLSRLPLKVKLPPLLSKVKNTVGEIYLNKKLFSQLFVFQLFMLLTFAWRYYAIFGMLGKDPGFLKILSMIPVVYLAKIIKIIPGNLGIQEFMATLGAKIIGFPLEIGLLVAVIDRIVTLVGNFILGIYFFFKLKYSEHV